MKKYIKISLLLVLIILCSACNGNITRDIRHDGFSVSNKFECSGFYPKNDKDTSYTKIKYLTNNNIIDEDGYIYEVSLGQTYANKENCKKANTDITVKAIFDNKIIKAKDDKYYYLVSSNNVESYSLVLDTDNSYELYDLLLSDMDVLKVMTYNSSTGLYLVLKTDGNVYSYLVNKDNYSSPLKIADIKTFYDRKEYGSKIIDFNYAGNKSGTYIKTEDDIYRMKAINYEKCNKYADVQCVYRMKKDDVINKYKDRIIAFNGSVLITDYKQVFTTN